MSSPLRLSHLQRQRGHSSGGKLGWLSLVAVPSTADGNGDKERHRRSPQVHRAERSSSNYARVRQRQSWCIQVLRDTGLLPEGQGTVWHTLTPSHNAQFPSIRRLHHSTRHLPNTKPAQSPTLLSSPPFHCTMPPALPLPLQESEC